MTDNFVTKNGWADQLLCCSKSRTTIIQASVWDHKVIPLHQHPRETVDEGQIQFLDVPYVKLTLAMDSCFAQFHAKIHNIKKSKQEKAHYEVNTLIFWQKADFGNFFHGVIIINVHVIIYHWKGQPFFCLKQFFFLFIQLMDEVMIIFKAKLSDNLTLFFPGGAKFWLQNVQNSFSERGQCPLSTPTRALPLDPDHFGWNGPWPFPSLWMGSL